MKTSEVFFNTNLTSLIDIVISFFFFNLVVTFSKVFLLNCQIYWQEDVYLQIYLISVEFCVMDPLSFLINFYWSVLLVGFSLLIGAKSQFLLCWFSIARIFSISIISTLFSFSVILIYCLFPLFPPTFLLF